MNDIAAVVVTYNRKSLLLENICCLLAQTYPLDIIIIDNASSDGTYEAIVDYINDNKILYFNTGSNLGGAGGFQYGTKVAVHSGYKYVWLMDDDCMPKTNALAELVKAGKELEVFGFLSSKVLWRDGSLCMMNVQRRTVTKPLKNYSGGNIRVAMASFVSVLIRTDVICEIGLPIKEFFIWTDDWEYTRRISLKYPCYAVCLSEVVHKSNSNIGADIASDSIDRLERYKFLYRNDVYLYRREGFKGFLYEVVRLTAHFFRILFKAKDHKFLRIKMMLAGTKQGFSFKPQIEYIDQL